MSTRSISFVPGEYYHIYNRGNTRQNIFRREGDYDRFAKLLFISNSVHSFNMRDFGAKNVYEIDREKQLVNILAYCFMPNHFHLLLTPLEENGVSTFMLRLGTSYAMFFNKKYERSGTLFEGPFKSRFVHDDVYMRYLFAYIHLNPLKLIDKNWKEKGLRNIDASVEYLQSYKHSSLIDYLSVSEPKREEGKIIDRDLYGELFNEKEVILDTLSDWFHATP